MEMTKEIAEKVLERAKKIKVRHERDGYVPVYVKCGENHLWGCIREALNEERYYQESAKEKEDMDK